MPKIKPEIESFARIKVVGVGGSGSNAINHMVKSKVSGIEFIAMNTDTQDLHNSLAERKIHLGKNITKGLGTGMNPELGKKAAEETKAEISESVRNADIVFISCGMGGGTGTGASPIIARTAKEQGILTVAVVTKPFFFEGNQRMRIAEKGIADLVNEVDAIIVIPNDKLLTLAEKDTDFDTAFAMSDEILRQAVEGISDLIITPGRINVDFADIRVIMTNAGSALMGIGIASGKDRAERAAFEAINSPLLELSINGAQGVLFSISGGDDLTLHEVQKAAKLITESIDSEARVIFGTIKDKHLKRGELKITVIATGFPLSNGGKKSLFQGAQPTLLADDTRNEPSKKKETIIIDSEDASEKPANESVIVDESYNDNEDWSAVPAFLRRGKK